MTHIDNSLFLDYPDLLDHLLATTTDHIDIYDRDGRYLYASPAGADAFGIATADLVGKTWHDLDVPAAVIEHQDSQRELVFQTGNRVSGEVSFPTVQGIRHYEYILSPLRNRDGTIVAVVSTRHDVTALTQQEQVLQACQADLSEVEAIAHLGHWSYHFATEQVYWSERVYHIHGLTPGQSILTGAEATQYIHPDDHDKYQREIVEKFTNRESFASDLRIFCPNGAVRFMEVRGKPVYDSQHTLTGFSGIVQDITARKQVEAKLREQEALLQLFAQYVPAGIAMFDREMRYLMASQRWLDNYHPGPLESFIGRSHYDILPGIPNHYKQVHQRCLAGGVEQGEGWFTGLNGSRMWTRWEVRPWYQDAGIIGGIIIFSEDITHRKQAELALQDLNQSLEQKVTERTAELRSSQVQIQQQVNREAMLREITQRIRQSLDLTTIFATACGEVRQWCQADRVGIFKFFPNSGWDDGIFVAEAVAPGFPSVLAIRVHDHCFGDQYAPLYQQGRVQAIADIDHAGLQDCHRAVLAQFHIRANLIVPLSQGNQLWGLLCIHQCATPRQWEPFEIQVAQEISHQLAIAIQQASLFEQLQQELAERQQAEASLVEINQELLRATQLKDEFLANMSHELRTPLNAILGMTEGLQEHIFGAINPQQLKALQTIEGAGLHLLALINDILDLAKVEAGQIELDCTPTVVRMLCQSSLEFIKQQSLKKQIQVDLKLPDHLPELLLDERRVRQVLMNLLSNAVKFTPKGGKITLEISITSSQSAGETTSQWLRFTVRDTGIGIAPEHMAKLFQPFVQVDSALNRQYGGTGLGLALVKRIVELHGGQVGLTSEVGVGSCFTIDLPYVLAPSVTPILLPPKVPNTEQNQSAPPTAPLILLVEDNEDNVITIAGYLEVKGYRLLLARNGQEAIDLLQAQRPDLILMDIQMPGMNGLEAIRHIRHDLSLRHLPIIALTALAMEDDRDRCLVAGANDYLSKPVKLKQLAATISRFLPQETGNP